MEILQNFSWFDIVLLLAVLILGIKGFANGIIREVFGLIGIIGGAIFASRFSSKVGLLISDYIYKIEKVAVSDFVGFIVSFVGFWIIALIIGSILSKLVKASGLGFVDRIGGFVVGSAKIFLIVATLFAVISRINFLGESMQKFVSNSHAYPILIKTGTWIMNLDTAKISNHIDKQLEKYDLNNSVKEEASQLDIQENNQKEESVTTQQDIQTKSIKTEENTTKE